MCHGGEFPSHLYIYKPRQMAEKAAAGVCTSRRAHIYTYIHIKGSRQQAAAFLNICQSDGIENIILMALKMSF